MLHSRFLSSTSALVVAAAVASAGCGDDSCGPGGATQSGLLASSAEVVINYGNITSGPNNDCPEMGAPAGVVSLTLQGGQTDAAGQFLTLCIRRPDLLAERPLQLGSEVLIIDLTGSVNGCSYAYEPGRPPTGTVSATGFCANGTDPAGYALTVDGNISLTRMCPTANDIIAVSFAGTVAVESRR